MAEELGDFICPVCGCTEYGTIVSADGTVTRHCHGYLPENVKAPTKVCLFHWSASEDSQYLLTWSDAEPTTIPDGIK